MAEGEFALVQKYLEIAIDKTASWVGEHDVYAMLADAAAQQRDKASLQKYAPLAELSAARYDHKLYQAVAHRAWGAAHRLAGQYTESQERFAKALEIFHQLGTRWQIGRTFFELGELAVERADHKAAEGFFTRALSEFDMLSASPDATRTREKLGLIQ